MSKLRFLVTDDKRHMTVGTLPGTRAVVIAGDGKALSVGSPDSDFSLAPHGVPAKNYMDFEPSALHGLSEDLLFAANIFEAALLRYDGARFKAVKKWSLRSKTVFASQLAVGADASGEVLMAAAADYLLRLQVKGKGTYVRIKDGALWGLAVSGDGKQIATGREDGRLELRDADSLEVTRALKPSEAPFLAMAFSPDGKQLALSDDRYHVFLMDLESAERTPIETDGKVIGLHYLSDGRLVVVNLSRVVRLFAGTECTARWDLHEELGDRYIQDSAVLGDESGVVLACEQKGTAFLSFG